MKINNLFLVLLLITSIKLNDNMDSYSIDTFKAHLKENGLFGIIQSIKVFYGQDVAIISCEELNINNKGNCKKLITEYMDDKLESPIIGPKGLLSDFNETSSITSQNDKDPSTGQSPNKTIKRPLIYWKLMKNSTHFLYIQDTPRKNFNKEELRSIYRKIMKKVKILPYTPSSINDFKNFLLSSKKK